MPSIDLYIVRTDAWYAERAGWLVAGGAILMGTLLSASVHSMLVGLVALVGLTSLVNAHTGFCPISTVLLTLGMPARLADPTPSWWGPVRLYRMRRDSWYLERGIYAVVGVNLTLASVLTVVHSPWWLLFTGFVGGASVVFAWTGFCPVANVLWRLGLEPRLGPAPHPTGRLHPIRGEATS